MPTLDPEGPAIVHCPWLLALYDNYVEKIYFCSVGSVSAGR
jgi:hypothetical protein